MRKLWLCAATAILLGAQAPSYGQDPLAPTGRWSAYGGGHAPTPPMGWSSWNAFFTDIDEEKVLASASKLVDSGLAAKGYRYINLDDGWWMKRRETDGRLIIRTDKFPSALTQDGSSSFRPFTDRLHAMGLKAGIYSDLGRNSCSQAYMPNEPNLPRGTIREREVGLHGHVDQDVRLYFAEWGFDYIKVDGCGIRAYGAGSEPVRSGRYRALEPLIELHSVNRSDIPAVQALFAEVDAALARHNPDGDYLFSLCIWGAANVRAWGKNYGNISRTSDDISPHWGRMLTNFDSAARRALYGKPGAWNDPDMLFIGKGDFDGDHLTEARSHFALWAIINAPLLIGTDLRTTPQSLMDVFGNEALIAINQDPGGHQAVIAYDSDEVQILVKTLTNGEKAVAVLNRGSTAVEAVLTAAHLKLRDDRPIELTDLWTGETTSFTGDDAFTLLPRQTLVFRVKGTRTLADGMYLSELPGNVNPAVDGVTTPRPDPSIHRSVVSWRGTRGAGERPIYAGWGGAQADSGPYGQELSIAGRAFPSGIGILANSRLEVKNPGHARLSVSVGVDDAAVDRRSPVEFRIYGDGRLLASSRPLRWGDGAQPLTADVRGINLIELVARADGGANEDLPVTWGEAALLR